MTQSKPSPPDSTRAAFRFRIGELSDIPHCGPLLPAGFCIDDAMRRKLSGLWGRLLASEARTFCVVEDLAQQHPSGIEGFGLSVFVTERFARDTESRPRPLVSAQFYEALLAGREDVLLTNGQIAEANATNGLHVVTLHFGLRNHDLSDPRTAGALMAGSAGFYFFHSGYRIASLINEVFGAQAAEFMTRGGFRLVNDFQRDAPAAFRHIAPEHYPYRFMLKREWIKPGAVNPMAQLFFPAVPQLLFSVTERRVLERALLNEADVQIARSLGLSLDRVKKTWRSAFARAVRAAPYLIPASDRESSGARGQEKRRHLLDYLRTHMEELRPYPSPANRHAGTAAGKRLSEAPA